MKIFLPPNGGRKTVETTFFFRGAFMALTRQKKIHLAAGGILYGAFTAQKRFAP